MNRRAKFYGVVFSVVFLLAIGFVVLAVIYALILYAGNGEGEGVPHDKIPADGIGGKPMRLVARGLDGLSKKGIEMG